MSGSRSLAWRAVARRATLVSLLASTLGATGAGVAGAQDVASGEGAIFLLIPVGARAVAAGGAVVAASEGSESVWWNPASVARQTRGEAAIHHGQTIAVTSDALAVVLPWRGLGVFAVAAHLVNLGEQEIVPPEGPPAIGRLLPRNVVASLSYARPFGRRLDVGVTYKLLQLRSDCSGQCGSVPVEAVTASAADVGARLHLGSRTPLVLGIALRNVGPDIQMRDRSARDPLPGRWHAGIGYDVPGVARYAPDITVHVGADLVTALDSERESYRVGTEVVWQKRVMLRGGYVFDAGRQSVEEGPAVGLGVVAGRLVVDIAREFQGLSVDAGRPPTYVTLRYRF